MNTSGRQWLTVGLQDDPGSIRWILETLKPVGARIEALEGIFDAEVKILEKIIARNLYGTLA